MKDRPPPGPLLNQEGEIFEDIGHGFDNSHRNSPLLDKEWVGGGSVGGGSVGGGSVGGGRGGAAYIHNKPALKERRKALRNEATPAEQKLWSALKHSQLHGYKFRRQHSVGYYIIDFYCPSERLAVEVDGNTHFTEEAMEYDKERTAFLNSLSIRVLRFLNTDVYGNLESVCERILEEIKNPQQSP